MTTISVSSTIGIHLSSPSYTNPVVINPGVTISSSTGNGVDAFTGAWTIENNGGIASTLYNGVYLGAGGMITNTASASISGFDGVNIEGGIGTVVNDGSIAGNTTSSIGVILEAGGSVTNQSGATISGYTGVDLTSGGTVTNEASASILGVYSGVDISGGTGTVVNHGHIAGTGGDGVVLGSGGSITNAAAASITGEAFGVDLSAGGTLTNAGTVIGNAGTAVHFGGTGSNRLVLDPGYGLSGIASGGTSAINTLELASGASAGTLSGLGTEFVGFSQTTIDANAVWVFNGTNTIGAGTTLTELSGSTLTVSSTLVNNGTIMVDPSTLTAADILGAGTVDIGSNSTLTINGVVAAGETLEFTGTNAVVNILDASGFAGTIQGQGSTNVVNGLCFLLNTRIATPSGERPVQELAVGDVVTTHRGAARRIVWIGAGKVVCRQGRRSAATPVIVRRGALAHNVPNRDLRVTKGHSLYLDDVLIPAEFLVNHRSILWDDLAQEVELYHIELETHDILVANGAPAESYRDDGNRWLFRNANSGWGLPPQVPCAPVLTGGPAVDSVWRRLLEHAGPRPGVPVTDDPDLHLMVDGRRVDVASRSDVWHIFHLAAPPATVRIVSRAGVPQEMGLARDPRSLGVALRQIMVTRGAQIRAIQAEDSLLSDGFHDYEADGDIRWTDGDAGVPAALFEGFAKPLQIALGLGCRTCYPDEGTAASCRK